MSCTLCANTRCLRCFCTASFVRTCAAFARFVRIRAAFDALCLHHRGISTLCANTCCLCVLFAQLSSTRHKVYFDRTMWRSLPRSCQQERGATTSSQHELQLSCHTVPDTEGLVVEASTGVKLVHRLQNVPGTLHAQCVCTLVFTPRTVCLHPRVHAHALSTWLYNTARMLTCGGHAGAVQERWRSWDTVAGAVPRSSVHNSRRRIGHSGSNHPSHVTNTLKEIKSIVV